jgi:hypothetical protein
MHSSENMGSGQFVNVDGAFISPCIVLCTDEFV